MEFFEFEGYRYSGIELGFYGLIFLYFELNFADFAIFSAF
jgi:hypothetical protein